MRLDIFDRVADYIDPPDAANWEPLPHQIPPPGRWFCWVLMGGRGAGKTATAARYVHDLVHGPPMIEGVPGGHWISIVGPTLGDAVTSCVEGPSGLRKWDPGIKVLQKAGGTICRWSNGVEAKLFGANSPDDVERFRAGGNRTFVWLEEFAAWRYMEESWQQIRYGLRSGSWPHCIISTTPKNRKVLKDIIADALYPEQVDPEGEDPTYVITRASTDKNPHLDERVRNMLFADYQGTRLGRQELYAEILDDVENALWHDHMIDPYRIPVTNYPEFMDRVVVGVDPQAKEGGNETGIVVCGKRNQWMLEDRRPHGFVLGDYSIDGSPDRWAKRAIQAFYDHEANKIVAEINQGGDMVKHTIQAIDPGIPVEVVHASRGKAKRAEPVATMYEQGRIHHVGVFPALEDQMCQWDPIDPDPAWSPDRMDAMVWAFNDLLVEYRGVGQATMRDHAMRGRR